MAICPSCEHENPEGFRFCGNCGVELVAAPTPREVRKTVTVVFCDVTGSTAMGERLDPESTRRVMARYFDEMRAAIERHGGTVEKFIGDAVMAVFGIPVVHEDDALRAVRAATDMRGALLHLNEELERDWGIRIESRIGVNTGEVVSGEGDSIATGDAVNVAARLEQGAAPGETLLGESTQRLVRDAVIAEPAEPLVAKGKSDPVPAFRLTGLVDGAEFIPRRLDSPMVGRENELAQLQRAFDHAVSERVAYQFTLLGPAGIGKSRLVRELHDRVGTTLLAGRCLPYGEGITYWPLAELGSVADEVDFEANRDEIALQTRRILERMAREQPLVVVFDDLQWAEPTFLDLIDHITDLSRDAPILLLCIARPDLLDLRPGWGGGKLNATTMLLEALTEDEAAQLVDNLLLARLGPGLRERIAVAAEGNPLYVEEMLAMVSEGGNGDIAVPPTIQALLAARLDGLPADERTVVECASIEGQEFRLDALAALVPDPLRKRLGQVVQSLVRKDLARPTGDQTFRFKHLLLRDAAYEALPKEQRADLHERFADWIEANVPGLEVILGYHLEQAYRYRAELGPVDDRATAIARRAAGFLAAAGSRALDRADIHASTNLLERAVQLLPKGDAESVALYPELASAITERGELDRAAELLRSAQADGDEATRLRARLRLTMLNVARGGRMAPAAASIEDDVAEAERLGDATLLAEALKDSGVLAGWLGDQINATVLLRRSREFALTAGAARQAADASYWWGLMMMWGPTHVDDALAEITQLAADANELNRSELFLAEGVLWGLKGDFERGRALVTQGRSMLADLGLTVIFAATSMPASLLEYLAGSTDVAEQLLRSGREQLLAAGERGYLSTVSGVLAVMLCEQGRFDEAEAMADEAKEMGAEDDWSTQMYWRAAKVRILASRGQGEDAARLAAELVELAPTQDGFDAQIVFVQIAPSLDDAAARQVLERALEACEAKGNIVTAARARELLAALP